MSVPRRFTTIGLPLVLAFAIAMPAGSPGADGIARAAGTSSQAAKKTPPKGLDKTARTLATRLAAARTAESAYSALRAVLKAIKIGVYTAAGARVQAGAERSAADFYLPIHAPGQRGPLHDERSPLTWSASCDSDEEM